MKNSNIRNNIILVTAIIICICLSFFAVKSFGGKGIEVVAYRNQNEIGRYSIYTNQTLKIENELGYNILVIEDGSVCIYEADCRNQICVHQGYIHEKGETICCLPHELIISIE